MHERNPIRIITAKRCVEFQEAAAQMYARSQKYSKARDLGSAKLTQDAAREKHNEMRMRLERLLGVDAIVEQR